jgi:hypothetical protein
MSLGETLRLRCDDGGERGELCVGVAAATGEIGGDTGGGLAVVIFSPRGMRIDCRGERNDAHSCVEGVEDSGCCVGLVGVDGVELSRGETRGDLL